MAAFCFAPLSSVKGRRQFFAWLCVTSPIRRRSAPVRATPKCGRISFHTASGSSADWSVAEVGDFNNDDTSDILWYRTDGSVLAWTMSNGQVGSLTDFGSAPTTWQIADSGDYDADGSVNLLWRHTSGSLATWELDSPPPQPATDLGALSNDWQIIA